MKSLLAKIFAFIFIISLSVGCASTLTAPQQTRQKKEIKKAPKPGNVTGDTNPRANVERPDL